jgi:hypothetical protein
MILPQTTSQQISQLLASPKINQNAISGFTAIPNSTTNGVDVSFTLTNTTGISTVNLLRNYVGAISTATLLQSWGVVGSIYAWSDTASQLQETALAYYWLVLSPVGVTGTSVTVGPQIILLNPDLLAPTGADGISASAEAVINGSQLTTVNVTTDAPSIKIYVSGYHGNAGFVAVAQASIAPIQFNLDATGETVTLKAIEVSTGGTEAATGPTATLTLNGQATVPAQIQNIVVAQLSSGNQIDFPASKDNVTSYKLYVGQYGSIFSVATLLATLTSIANTVNYLDTNGLGGNWQYFVVAVNAIGSSTPSAAAFPPAIYSSATIPSNVPANTANNATVDSVDSGTSALVRIYGPGGVGTSYLHYTGYGSVTRSPGTVSGLGYATVYDIIWTGSQFIAVTTYPATLPDNFEFIGGLTTTSQTGVVGSGATVTLVINSSGNVIQANPGNLGSNYVTATVDLTGGGGGSGAVIQANVVNGQITSYTVINGGVGYSVAPTGTVVGGSATGTTGGGGSTGSPSGSRIGCVEEGTLVEIPEGTVEELLPCDEWVVVDVGNGPLYMAPDTLVSVFKKAKDLTSEDMIEVKHGNWRKGDVSTNCHSGTKVKRACPGGVYHAGPDMVRVHNMKLGEIP